MVASLSLSRSISLNRRFGIQRLDHRIGLNEIEDWDFHLFKRCILNGGYSRSYDHSC